MKLDFQEIYKKIKGEIPCRQNCSNCCVGAGILVFLPKEYEYFCKKVPKAKKYIKSKKLKGIKFYFIKLPCPFLKNNKCSIRENRPFDCRIFPLNYCIFNNKVITFIAGKYCPALKKISKKNFQKTSKLIIDTISKINKKWINAMKEVGSCGDCGYKNICNQKNLIFDKDSLQGFL